MSSSAAKHYELLKKRYTSALLPCELCNYDKFLTLQTFGRVAEPGVYGELVISACERCGFKMQNPRYEDAFYEEYYKELYRNVAFGDLTPSDLYLAQQATRGEKVRLWADENGIKAPGKLLDHGCASGATMQSWIENGWSCTGIDPHLPSVLLAQKLNFDVVEASGESLPFADETFDAVLTLGSLEHVFDLEKSMHELRRVLKDGGSLIIRWRSNEIFGSPLEYFNHNHYRFFTPNTLDLLMKSHGFKSIVSTNKKLEGWDSYSYSIAVKQSNEAIKKPHWKHDGDDPLVELNALQGLRKSYYQRCKLFVDVFDEMNGDAASIIRWLIANKQDISWGLLGGEDQERLNRSYMEAKQYLSCFELQLVV